jgi:type I restriction enzyme S subunit
MGYNVHSNGWPTKALIDCTADGVISYGIVQPGQNTNKGVPIVRVNNFKQGRLDVSDVLRVAVSVEDNYKRTRLRGGEVLLTLVGSTGQTAIASSKLAGWNVARAIAVIRPADEIGAKWISICLQSVETKQFLDERANTTVQKTLNLADVKRIPIPLPPVHVRRSIESVFSSLDDKINLNRRINQTLEAMAQAIFKSWFVDFDPVKAKIAAIEQGEDPLRAAMCAISGKTDAELDQMPREHHDQLAATAALFPDAMEDSELGEIPKGWNSVPFGCLLSHTIGGDWGTEAPDTVNDTRVAIIRGTDIPDLDQAQLSRVPIRYTNKKKLATRRLQVGDIVLEVSGGSKDQPTGRSFHMTANALREFDCPVEPASFCRLLRPVSLEAGVVLGLHLSYIYQQGKTWEYQNQSTGIANFQTSHFLEAELVVVPPNSILEVFFGMISPILERRHDAQGRKLALTRDTLLPKLMSGEIPVSCQLNEDAQ